MYVQFQLNEAQVNEMLGMHARQYKQMSRAEGWPWATFVSCSGRGVWTYFVWVVLADTQDQSARSDPNVSEITNRPRWLTQAYTTHCHMGFSNQ